MGVLKTDVMPKPGRIVAVGDQEYYVIETSWSLDEQPHIAVKNLAKNAPKTKTKE